MSEFQQFLGLVLVFGMLFGALRTAERLRGRFFARLLKSFGRGWCVFLGCAGIPFAFVPFLLIGVAIDYVPYFAPIWKFFWYSLRGEYVSAFVILTFWMFSTTVAWNAVTNGTPRRRTKKRRKPGSQV